MVKFEAIATERKLFMITQLPETSPIKISVNPPLLERFIYRLPHLQYHQVLSHK
ncbi:hypothetical protein [Planktothricoides raciborskii]|uniref:Uncharacterized protein n=1 Tax=Planktothricoides raciborskii FACHB-1370 TaxID=2949576 RepID=A0ABR8E705_9CYAN|nr:hypothetical protein [Planktothricoides raciborskii]MBD2542599.1 hypothetical protein [Planktothricoides raciborskii FACHB-1370]